MIKTPLLYLLYFFIPLSLRSQGLGVSLSKINKDCFLGSAAISINTGASPFQVNWSNGAIMNSVSDLDGGDYWVKVTDNTTHDTTIYFTIEDLDCIPSIANNFTPNGDEFNDTWSIMRLEHYPDFELFVYNRWGQEVHRQINFYIPWNGTSLGLPLPDGTYYYILYLSKINKNKFLKGDVSILR
jgi:gliding motility-associated-like protein